MRDLFHLPRSSIDEEQVSDTGWCRDQRGYFGPIRRRTVREHRMAALRERFHFAGFRIDALQVHPSLFGGAYDYAAAIRTPIESGISTGARRSLIATYATRDIEVIRRR